MNGTTHLSFKNKSYIIVSAAILSLVILAAGYLYYQKESNSIRQEKYNELKAVADLKEERIKEWIKERTTEVRIVARAPAFAGNIEHWLKNPENAQLKRDIDDRILRLFKELEYENIFLVSMSGRLLFSAKPGQEAFDMLTKQKFDDAVTKGELVVSDLFYDADEHKIFYDLISPVINGDHQTIAVMLFRRDPNKYLYPIIRTWPTPSKSAEIVIAKVENDSVLILNELRHQQNTALTLKIPMSRMISPAVQAALGHTGMFEGTDYRGVDVLADIRTIPAMNWIMLAKIDKSEIYAELHIKAFSIIGFCILLIALVCFALIWIYNSRQKNTYMELYSKEKELWQSQERFKVTIDSLGDGVITTDIDGKINYVNTMGERLTGWNLREARGQSLEDVYIVKNEETGLREHNIIRKVFELGIVKELANHTILISKNGEEIPIMDTGAPIYDSTGSIVGLVLTFHDETEKRLQQKLLKESEQRLRSTLDTMLEGCQIIGLNWRYLYINESAARQNRRPREELMGNTYTAMWPGIEATEVYAAMRRCMEQRIIQHMITEFTFPDGAKGWFSLSIQPVPEGILILSEDITERKNLEKQMLRAQRMESIGTLAGGIAHDLNNILSPILLSMDIINNKLTDKKSRNILRIVEASAKRGSDLIKQVLSFARGVEGERQTVQIRHIIDETGKIVRETFPKSIALHMNIPGNLPTIDADPTHLHQVLMNICVNARDAMPNGGVLNITAETIKVDEHYARLHIEAKPGPYIVISVTDQGQGIPPEIIERIFEPFFTTKEFGRGTGLGLSTVISIVKSYGGFVNVYSEMGRGTAFKIHLPVQIGTQQIVKEEHEEFPTGSGELVLVVDDESSIREITKVTLEAYGYSVITARDGNEAVAIYTARGAEIAVVVTDMMMPNMDGAVAIKMLQQMNPAVKILAVSGLNQNGDHITQESVLFLYKPYTSEKLLKALGTLLHKV